MKVERSQEGVIVAAQDLAPLLGLEPAKIPDLMKAGFITSRFEQGQGEDAKRFRVTFLYQGRQVRLTCDLDGTVRSTFKSPIIG